MEFALSVPFIMLRSPNAGVEWEEGSVSFFLMTGLGDTIETSSKPFLSVGDADRSLLGGCSEQGDLEYAFILFFTLDGELARELIGVDRPELDGEMADLFAAEEDTSDTSFNLRRVVGDGDLLSSLRPTFASSTMLVIHAGCFTNGSFMADL